MMQRSSLSSVLCASPIPNTKSHFLTIFKRRLGRRTDSRDAGEVDASFRASVASANNISDISPNDLAIEAAQETKLDVCASLPRSLSIGAHELDCIAPFRRDEIVLGPLLGSGEFANVYEIRSFSIQKGVDQDIALSNPEKAKKRRHMKKNEKYRQTDNARYALKHIKDVYLKDSLKESSKSAKYVQAARDLSLEAEILASLNHPHIIKLRGITHCGAAGLGEGPGGYFLIIDRLFETLDKRMRGWREQRKNSITTKNGRRSFVSRRVKLLQERLASQNGGADEKPKSSDEIMDERLDIAFQISAAMVYLHSHCIIFRDLKPANIGFDVRGDVKIFDFGLAHIMPEDGQHYEETFEMSGAGSPRYMAPECLSGQAYNMKADVYSFSILLWEMLAGQVPYAFARTTDSLTYHVVYENGRPDIQESWPIYVKDMLETSFDSNMEKRPEMEHLYQGIRNTLTSLRGGHCDELGDTFILRRRSLVSFRKSSGTSGLLSASELDHLATLYDEVE